MIDLIKSYALARRKWKQAGKPIRTPERMVEIHDICKGCDHFKPEGGFMEGCDQCGVCSCNLSPTEEKLNKIAWATTECPAEEPLWGPEISSEDA